MDGSRDRQVGLLRREWPIAAPLLSEKPPQVRAADYIGILAEAPAPGSWDLPCAPWRRLRCPDRIGRRVGGGRNRRLGGLGGWRRQPGPAEARRRLRDVLSASV